MRRFVATLVFSSLATFSRADATSQATSLLQQRFERLAAETSHFATDDIIRNYFFDGGRWPVGLLEEQQRVLEELRSAGDKRQEIVPLLQHRDPRVRTLALGALFVREDPKDLPLIASLMGDGTETLPHLGMSGQSMGGRLPLSSFESRQTVGDVAQSMIAFYLGAAGQHPGGSLFVSDGRPFGNVSSSAFDKYWSERRDRSYTAGWFLVKMWRATRRTTPLQRAYEPDVRRVLAEIDGLSPDQRRWTLVWVWNNQRQIDALVSDAAMVATLKVAGPDTLMKVVRGESPIDDPDLRGDRLASVGTTAFILAHAPSLLRPSDATAVLATPEAEAYRGANLMFVAAAARLRGLEDIESAATSLKNHIQAIPLTGFFGGRDQARLAFALWQMRGVAERPYLIEWFYTMLPAQRRSPDDLEYFLRAVEKERRPDTMTLLAGIVADRRFDNVDWTPLWRILEIVNSTLPAPLVEPRTIHNYAPGVRRPDEAEVVAGWRTLLRQHFMKRR
jgi:hypothetical protein